MGCPQCRVNPRTHSFVQFGRTPAGVKLWYSAAGKTDEIIDTPEKFNNFKVHLDQALAAPWIWVIDLDGMTLDNQTPVSTHIRVATALASEHSTLLHEIWIVNPTLLIKAAVSLLSVVQPIRYFNAVDAEFMYEIRTAHLTSIPWKARK